MPKQYGIKNEVLIENVLGNTLRTWVTFWELDGNTLRKDPINMCLFMSMIFILIEIKFDININNDELLIIIWKT
jgi:hypothetical protein